MAAAKKSWSSYTLRTQLLIAGFSTSFASLLLVEILCLVFLGVIINNISGTTNSILSDEVRKTLTASVDDVGSLFENDLNKTAHSIAMLLRRATGDMLRSDQPFATVPSFFDSPTGLQAAGPSTPSANERNAGTTISLLHSTYLIPNAQGNDAPTLTPDQTAFLESTAHLDPIFKILYKYNTEVLELYAGFTNGLFRRFPGSSTSRTKPAYDPRERPWYKSAQESPQSLYVVTDPYLDAFGKGWMFTVSAQVMNYSTGQFAGVVGIDVTITTLKQRLETQAVRGGSSSLYLLKSGVALSAPSWDLSKWTSESPFTYKDAVSPSISADLWGRISTAKLGVSTSEIYSDPATSEQYLVLYKALNITNGKTAPSYVSLSTFPLSRINVPIQNVQSTMTRIFGMYSGISVGIFAAVVVLVLTSFAALATSATRPLVRLSEESQQISRNIGEQDLFSGVGANGATKGKGRLGAVDETEELSKRFYDMVTSLRETEAFPKEKNPFFQNGEMPGWNKETHPQQVVDSVPDLPPSYHSVVGGTSNGDAAGSSSSAR
ncbi:hypothetical protein BJ742DRAFT_741069 [Cladochytrium replicatum]|nr:hypothetical protein BJ742DRAFT_741069 [Cladochytrium replicatum]